MWRFFFLFFSQKRKRVLRFLTSVNIEVNSWVQPNTSDLISNAGCAICFFFFFLVLMSQILKINSQGKETKKQKKKFCHRILASPSGGIITRHSASSVRNTKRSVCSKKMGSSFISEKYERERTPSKKMQIVPALFNSIKDCSCKVGCSVSNSALFVVQLKKKKYI